MGFIERYMPDWVVWRVLTEAGIGMLATGAIAALLLVSGGWLKRVVALAAVAWFVYSKWAFTVSGYWNARITATGDMTPYYVFVAIGTVMMLVMSVLAFVSAAQLWRVEQAHRADSAR